ncbi:AraC family transcriptional regulator [Alkalicella caledoniensis]|uniref:AraC family transcriptional regulator n=1 Tax=Alkalicella caledoniensis TaxID=2731377 RepID=A0A7G9W8Q0_ALKCA|nr:AraC family transcriptional regulator [Alkalicella caledoniensis]QNO15062.1 AraC family transcriptional regulator [Alkalicella caledoniensis]
MDYTNLIQKTIDYIDDNIFEEITVENLAKIAGFSTYHYYKLFRNYVGVPIKEYVTRRRLQYALYELSQGKKIIDIAMTYGFETHAGFTKAFKKTFGYPPNFYRIHAPIGIPQRVNLKRLKDSKAGGIVMQPKITCRDGFKLVGYEFKTTLNNNAHCRDIPAFLHRFETEDKEIKLYETQNPPKHGEYGICTSTNLEKDEFSYILGVEVTNFDSALEEMYTLDVLPATYAVFTSPDVSSADFEKSVIGTWQYILEEWFPNSPYEIDDSQPDFEFYNERCHPWVYEKVHMYIYIPVKIKSRNR